MDVQIRCVCPGSPHETDRVTLRDKLDSKDARATRYDVKALYFGGNEPSNGDVMSTLVEDGLIYGIESWTLVDEQGKPVEVSRKSITERILSSYQADVLGDIAVPLYQVSVIDPLVAQVSDFSPPTPTNGSTSAPKPSDSTTEQSSDPTSTPPKPSRRSSTSTTRTVGTETTSLSLVGVSNSSQNSESAA